MHTTDPPLWQGYLLLFSGRWSSRGPSAPIRQIPQTVSESDGTAKISWFSQDHHGIFSAFDIDLLWKCQARFWIDRPPWVRVWIRGWHHCLGTFDHRWSVHNLLLKGQQWPSLARFCWVHLPFLVHVSLLCFMFYCFVVFHVKNIVIMFFQKTNCWEA